MIEVAIMIERQNSLPWERWQRIANLVEDMGITGLYKSDHYSNANPPDKFTKLNNLLDELLNKAGREFKNIKRSMMTGCEFGRNDAEVKALVEKTVSR